MCCMGQGASSLFTLQLQAAARTPQPEPKRDEPQLRLRYLGQVTLAFRGPSSGRVYESEVGAELPVDPGDHDALLRTGFFEPI